MLSIIEENNPQTQLEKFWEKVNKDGPLPPYKPELGNCWLYLGSLNKHGYGLFHYNHKKSIFAHRISYEVSRDVKIPDLMVINHLCSTRSCIRPSHLEMITRSENTSQGVKDAWARRKIEVINNHCITCTCFLLKE